jgi:hypothetical protein
MLYSSPSRAGLQSGGTEYTMVLDNQTANKQLKYVGRGDTVRLRSVVVNDDVIFATAFTEVLIAPPCYRRLAIRQCDAAEDRL